MRKCEVDTLRLKGVKREDPFKERKYRECLSKGPIKGKKGDNFSHD